MRSDGPFGQVVHGRAESSRPSSGPSRAVEPPRFGLGDSGNPIIRDEYIVDGAISTDQDVEAVLAGAVEQALTAGVDVRGAREFETNGSVENWEVEVFELYKEFDGAE